MIGAFKIGFMASGSYDAMEAAVVCDSLRNIGYDSVEWPCRRVSPVINAPAGIKALVETTKRSGLAVSEAVVQEDLIKLDAQDRKRSADFVCRCINELPECGITTINLFTGPAPWGDNPVIIGKDIKQGDAWGMLFDAFDIFVPLAEKSGMTLALENVWGMVANDFFTAKHLVSRYNSTRFGVNYDPSHDVLRGHADVGWIVRQWGSDIKHIHLKDAAGRQENGAFVFPLLGEGHVDWDGFFQAVSDIGYGGYMSVEFESFAYLEQILAGDMEEAARISFGALKQLILK